MKAKAGRSITLRAAKQLRHSTILYSKFSYGADDRPHRWMVNGKVKTWKRDPNRVLVPLKHGLWDYGYLTEDNRKDFSLEEIDVG